MCKLPVILCLSLLLILAGTVVPVSADSERAQTLKISMPDEGPTQRVYFYSAIGDEKALVALYHRLVEQGAAHVNGFLPHTIACDLPVGRNAHALVKEPGIAVLSDAQVEASLSSARARVFTPQWVKQCYAAIEENALTPYEFPTAPPMGMPVDSELMERTIFEVPKETVMRTAEQMSSDYPEPRNVTQNSELLLGTILVQLVLPESSPHPLNKEDWTDESAAIAISNAVTATLYYQNAFEKVPMGFLFNKVEGVLTNLEPIQHPIRETAWIEEVMTTLGYPDDGTLDRHLTAVHEFNNDKRREYGTQWVFTAFIADAEKDSDHMFESARAVGWSYLGGPYLVVSYPAGEFNLGQAFKYYMGSQFWGMAEEPGSAYGCDDYSGYLDYQNRNKTLGYDPVTGIPKACRGISGIPYQCCMNSKDLFENYYADDPCEFTAGQFGLVDKSPRNGVPDCLDAPPEVHFASAQIETVFSQRAVISFDVVSEGVPNQNRRQDPEMRVRYKVPVKFVGRSQNGIITQKIMPLDGEYDELVEEFEFQFERLPGGASQFGVITKNAANSQSEEQVKELYYIGLSYLQFSFQNRNDGTWLEWRLLGDTFDANLEVHRVDVENGGVDEVIATGLQPSGPKLGSFTPYGFLDQSVVRGNMYRYYITGTLTHPYRDADTTVTTVTHEVETRAMYPISSGELLSTAVPNPFNEVTMISVKVPPSYRDLDAEFPSPIPTDVKVTVYDVLGRFVDEIYSDTIYGQVVTIPWDGTDRNNEQVPAGVYFVKTVAGGQQDAQKIVIVR